MEYIIRELKKSEYKLLEDFLYAAIFIKECSKLPPKSIIYEPLLWRTIEKFGELKDDYCLVAETENKVIGAVWVRIADQYGHIDDETPSFSISLLNGYRGKGIGSKMMRAMLSYLKECGYKRASLSVQKENYACNMYKRLGFNVIEETKQEYIMVYNFK